MEKHKLQKIRKNKRIAEKNRQNEIQEKSKVGMLARGKCHTCKVKVLDHNRVACIVCDKRYHSLCVNETSAYFVCVVCIAK